MDHSNQLHFIKTMINNNIIIHEENTKKINV